MPEYIDREADKEIIETLEAYMCAVRDEQSDGEKIKQYAKDIAEDIKMLLSVGEQIEIEQLKMNSDSRQTYNVENIDVAHIKAEAIKEFAEKLKYKLAIGLEDKIPSNVYAFVFVAINNLIKEKTEVNDNAEKKT